MKWSIPLIVVGLTWFSLPNALARGVDTWQASGTARARPGLSGSQARLMAERGAQVVAARNLLARESGVRRYVGPGHQHFRGVVAGHHYLPARHLPDGRAGVTVRKPPASRHQGLRVAP